MGLYKDYENQNFSDYSLDEEVKNYDDMDESEHKKRVRRMLEERLEKKRLKDELEEEWESDFDWDDLEK